MLLERFGLWDVRARACRLRSRAGCCSGSRSAARCSTSPSCSCSTSRSTRSTRTAPSCSTASSRSSPATRTFVVATHDPERLGAARERPGRVRVTGYFRDAAALARKDLLLELRGRDTLPAMALFVVAMLVVFRFALPGDEPDAGRGPALDRDPVFTALLGLGRAFVRRARAGRARRARARAVRPERDLAREARSRRSPSSSLVEAVALPAFALFFERVALGDGRRGRAREHRHLRGRHAARGDGRRRPRARAAPAAPLPAARASRSSSAASARPSRDDPGRYLGFLGALRRRFRDTVPGRPLSTSSSNNRRGSARRAPPRVLLGAAACWRSLWAPEDADQGDPAADLLRPRPDRADRVRVLRLGRVEGAAAALDARRALRPRELHRRPPGDDLRRAHARHRLDLGEDTRGASGGAGASASSCSS